MFEQQKRLRSGPMSYLSSGSGDSPLVLIHGVGLNADIWQPQIAALSPTRPVIAIDMPGHGESDRLPGTVDLDHFVAAVAAFCRSIGVEKATLCGHSMGALISLGLALDHRELFDRVVLLSAVYKRDHEAARQVQERAAHLATSSDGSSLGPTLDRWFGADCNYEAERHAVARMMSQVDAAGYAAAYSVFATSDRHYAGRISDIKIPLWCITGELDPNSTPAMSQRLAAEAPKGRCEIVAGARHMLAVTHPDAVTRNLASRSPQSKLRP